MTDLQRYLKSEYRDPEYQEHRLAQDVPARSWAGLGGLAAIGGLCFFIVNFLYWCP